jgi:hypothetical protein
LKFDELLNKVLTKGAEVEKDKKSGDKGESGAKPDRQEHINREGGT